MSCVLCRRVLTEPLLLPCCGRSVCAACAKSAETVAGDDDKASVYSETDSGVVVASSSAENNTVHNVSVDKCSSVNLPSSITKCPSCGKPLLEGFSGLLPCPGMARIVGRYRDSASTASGSGAGSGATAAASQGPDSVQGRAKQNKVGCIAVGQL